MAEQRSSGDIQVVQRVAQLLAQFTVHRPQLSVAEAAALVGLNRTTVARYFGSMLSAGLLERARDEPASYVPGWLILQLGAVAQGQRKVLDIAPGYLRALAREAELTAVISLLGPAGPIVTMVSEVGTFPVLITVRVGTVLDMDSAQGHLFLRFSSDTAVTSAFRESLTTSDRARIERLVAATSERGIAYAHSDSVDISILSAPIFDEQSIVATVALIGTTARLPLDSAPHEDAVLRAAVAMTAELGGLGVWRDSIAETPALPEPPEPPQPAAG